MSENSNDPLDKENGMQQGTQPPAPQQQLPSVQELMTLMVQQQQQTTAMMQLLTSKPSNKGAMLKPEVAPKFAGNGYELWTKNLSDWENLHYAIDEHQKAGLLMRALSREPLALARAHLRSLNLALDWRRTSI